MAINHPHAVAHQRGASLMDLVVGMAIGLLVIGIAHRMVATSRQQHIRLTEVLHLNTAQRQAFRQMQHSAVHMGQYMATTSETQVVTLTAARLVNATAATLPLAVPASSQPGATDCLGRNTLADGFLLSTYETRNGSLYCNTADNSGAQAVVDGWTSMSVQWFVASPGGIQVQHPIAQHTQEVMAVSPQVLGHATCLLASPGHTCQRDSTYRSVAWSLSERPTH